MILHYTTKDNISSVKVNDVVITSAFEVFIDTDKPQNSVVLYYEMNGNEFVLNNGTYECKQLCGLVELVKINSNYNYKWE